MNAISSVLSFTLAVITCTSGAAQLQTPSPGPVTTTDAAMSIVNKRQVGSFTLRWKPARDSAGHERRAYDILSINCGEVRSASGAPLPPAAGGRLRAMAGPPYAVRLSNCTCRAAVTVHTAPVSPERYRSAGVEVKAGGIFGRPC